MPHRPLPPTPSHQGRGSSLFLARRFARRNHGGFDSGFDASNCAVGQGALTGDGTASTCIIKPHVTVQLGSAISGVLSDILVDRGDAVKRGQVVARLELSVEQATLALDQLRASNDSAIKVEQADKELTCARRSARSSWSSRRSPT